MADNIQKLSNTLRKKRKRVSVSSIAPASAHVENGSKIAQASLLAPKRQSSSQKKDK